MNRGTKFVLDIGMGAVIPILILTYLSEPLGNITAYVVASLVPVSWVFTDLLFITRRFNFVTSYMGLFAIVNGLLTFWFVDGLRYAIKDSISFVLTVSLFGGSLLVGKPFMKYFIAQTLNPDTPEREAALAEFLHKPPVYRSLVIGSLIFASVNALTGTINFVLNLFIVTAPFGTEQFNHQVAQVNAITRIALNIPEMIGLFIAVVMIIHTIYQNLSVKDETLQVERDFWKLLELQEPDQQSGSDTQSSDTPLHSAT